MSKRSKRNKFWSSLVIAGVSGAVGGSSNFVIQRLLNSLFPTRQIVGIEDNPCPYPMKYIEIPDTSPFLDYTTRENQKLGQLTIK